MQNEKFELAIVKSPNLHNMILHPVRRYTRFALSFFGLGFIAWTYFSSRTFAALPEISYAFLGVGLLVAIFLLMQAFKGVREMFTPCSCGNHLPAAMLNSGQVRLLVAGGYALAMVSFYVIVKAVMPYPNLVDCALALVPGAFVLGVSYLVLSLFLRITKYEEKIAVLAADDLKGIEGKSDAELLKLAGLANKLCLTEKANAILQIVDKRGGE